MRDEAEVDYDMSPHHVLVPVAVSHHEYRDGELTAENLFTYGPFRRFGAESGITYCQVQQSGRWPSTRRRPHYALNLLLSGYACSRHWS